ncbi:MAG TPA: class I SAM-dependent RNA methyltransferase [Smithellaceae bacterium]|jgi:putative N6-adenine-specific DNA methylase|nr:class I SAM-dependent RNA methyltransferase [Syntrophaceae bacterium]HPL97141.1 class I SAM-dependent RNA methyltransferase [Smithellaceae bacterium]HPV49424.1 class I SAM-dependent RNA methyltransferase [Smithellaceae bacterium]
MSFWEKKSKILATCPRGAAGYLRTEIESLGFPVLSEIDTACQTEGTLEDTMLLNLHLRTAGRVLYQLQIFKVITPAALYERLKAIPWEKIIFESGPDAYVCVTSAVDTPQITDSRFANMKVKDAIVDRIRDKTGLRPDSGPEKDRALIHLYWRNDLAIVYIDTSGEHLSRRGYRKIPLAAPMRETLAASLVMATGWKADTPLINPMCGSGTLAIEAALIALERAPGLGRNHYGFMHIKNFPRQTWQEMRKKARAAARKNLPAALIASDIDPAAVEAARRNAETAGVGHLIEFKTLPFEKTPVPGGGGVIILNPPYGERLDAVPAKSEPIIERKMQIAGEKIILRKSGGTGGTKQMSGTRQKLERLYENCGNWFKSVGRGYRGYIFTGNMEMAAKVGLRTKRRLTFYNGQIECRLLEYELYAGSKKSRPPEKKQEND